MRVEQAYQRQIDRQSCSNAQLGVAALREHCQLSSQDQALLERAADKLQHPCPLDAPGNAILKVARTIADLDASADIVTRHLSEGINYRRLNI